MSLLKDISIENIIKMPESATENDITREVALIEFVIERVREGDEDFNRFRYLADKWKEETFVTSSLNIIESNPSYLEIIGMGRKVLPFIFEDLMSKPSFWFSALEKITGCDPIKPSHIGYIKLMTEDWLKWGEEHGYI